MSTYLNVILHGLYLMVQRPLGIEILIPDMGPDHTYRAGEWLGEITLAPGTYWLSGVDYDGKKFCDPSKNFIVNKCQPNSVPESLYARIFLPPPIECCSLRPTKLTSDELSVDPTLDVSGNPKDGYPISTVQVLRYHIQNDDPKNVRLSCHHFTKSAQQFDDDFYMSLHIIAAPDFPEYTAHAKAGFATLVNMGEGLKDRIQLLKVHDVPSTTEPLPRGIIAAELSSLIKRVERLTYIGRSLRRFYGREYDMTSEIRVGVDGDIVTCLPLVFETRGGA